MTNSEAFKVAKVLTNADSGCPTCAASLFRLFSQEFPGFEDVLDVVWKEEFDTERRTSVLKENP